jgi:hypothetical protein
VITFYIAAGSFLAWCILQLIARGYTRIVISSARFFYDIPESNTKRPKLRIFPPRFSTRLLLQLLALITLVALLYPWNKDAHDLPGTGLRILIDTSHSMTTRQNEKPRLTRAIDLATNRLLSPKLVETLLCIEIEEFNRELTPVYWGVQVGEAINALSTLHAKPVGTDLRHTRYLRSDNSSCKTSHMIIITDLPSPSITPPQGIRLEWIDISAPVTNFGIGKIEARGSRLTNTLDFLNITLNQWGASSESALVAIEFPDKTVERFQVSSWNKAGEAELPLYNPSSGEYRITIVSIDDYDGDDKAIVELPEFNGVNIEWNLREKNPFTSLSNRADKPTIEVTYADEQSDTESQVLISKMAEGKSSLIGLFENNHAPITGLNLDEFEKLELIATTPPLGFRWLLADEKGKGWVAVKDDPRSVYLPPLTLKGEPLQVEVSAHLLFQSILWILESQKPTLSTRYIIDDTTQNNEPLWEGMQNQNPRSIQFQAKTTNITQEFIPYWHLLIALAALMLAGDQLIRAYK